MLSSLVICLILHTSSVFAACFSSSESCSNDQGFVPSDCVPDLKKSLPDVYSYCNENGMNLWKKGVTDGSAKTNDLTIDNNFIFCWESFATCGYVSLFQSKFPFWCGKPEYDSGVKIGGIDLGQQDSQTLQDIGTSTDTLQIFNNYIGLQESIAAEKICTLPFSIPHDEAYNLTIALISKYAKEMETMYNTEKANDALLFNELPFGIRTVLISVRWKWGYSYNTKFWQYIKLNDFENAIYELRHWYSNGISEVSSRRLRSAANVIEASLGCVSNIDCVFLLDESGSVRQANFDLSLDWIDEFVASFDESNLDQSNSKIGTRFGIATFSSTNNLVDEFYLNAYETSADYKNHILNIVYSGGGTYLGAALEKVGKDQFSELNGMRASSLGIPRLLIVLTDGRASDDVAAGVATLDGLKLNIIAIGIANYNMDQLLDITSTDHIYTIDSFTELSTILDGVITQTCYVPSQLHIDDILQDISIQNGQGKYFKFETSGQQDQNIVVNIQQAEGCVYVYVSYCVQYPSYYVHDVKFTSCAQPHKQIVLSPTLHNCSEYEVDLGSRRRLQSSSSDTIYVALESVGSGNETARFHMDINACNITSNTTNCTVGSNYDEALNVDEAYDYYIDTNFANEISTTAAATTTAVIITDDMSTSGAATSTTNAPNNENNENNGSTNSENNGSMSVGIGVGVGIALCIVIALVVYFVVIKPRRDAHRYVRANIDSETGADTNSEDQQLI